MAFCVLATGVLFSILIERGGSARHISIGWWGRDLGVESRNSGGVWIRMILMLFMIQLLFFFIVFSSVNFCHSRDGKYEAI